MKKLLFAALAAAALMLPGHPVLADQSRVLFIYDEVNDQTKPYLAHFRGAFADAGIPFEEAAAAELRDRDLSGYDVLVVHGIVMAFNSKSPIRDWLKTKPNLEGRRVHLLVTANRWFLRNLFRDLTGLLDKSRARTADAVSMATKTTDDDAERAAVRDFVSRVK